MQTRIPEICSKPTELWGGRVVEVVIFWGVQKATLKFHVQTRTPEISPPPTELWGGHDVEGVIFWGVQKAIPIF